MGPGLRTSLAVVYSSFEDDFPGSAGNNDGISVVWGIHPGSRCGLRAGFCQDSS